MDHFTEECLAAEVEHEVLGVSGEAEGDAEFFEEEGAVGGAIGEVDVDVLDAELAELLRHVVGVAGAGEGFVAGAVGFVVAADGGAEFFAKLGGVTKGG